jgi:hypothetical protein
MTTKSRLPAQGRTPREADTLDGNRNNFPTGPAAVESDTKFRELAVGCAWAVAGILLTIAAIWFGLEIR